MKKRIIIVASIFISIFAIASAYLPGVFDSSARKAEADAVGIVPGPVTGYLWSSNIGWIKMDSSATGGVQILADNTLSGYAWSSNLGWLRFGDDLTGPAGATDAWGAKIDGDSVTGWARFCSVYKAGCAGEEKDINGSELGGWDGWLKMYNVTYTLGSLLGVFQGYAWGGLNVGWVVFSYPSIENPGVCCSGLPNEPAGCVCGGGGGDNLNAICTADKDRYDSGEPVTLTLAVPTGGTSPYNYSWISDNQLGNAPPDPLFGALIEAFSFVTNYTEPGTYSPSVTVTDSASPVNSQTVVCTALNGGGIIVNPACVEPNGTIEVAGQYCCSDLAQNPAPAVGYICPSTPPDECKFSFDMAGSGEIRVNFGSIEGGTYTSSSGNSLEVVVPETCADGVNLIADPLFPTDSSMVCKKGSSGFSSDCAGLKNGDIVGASAVSTPTLESIVGGQNTNCGGADNGIEVTIKNVDNTHEEKRDLCFGSFIHN